jgi:hypothetical protein
VIPHISLHAALQQSAGGFADLVTRPTGRAVRATIEADLGETTIAAMDFAGVGCIDFSCADEIVAKLLRDRVKVLLVRGLADGHREALEPVLEGAGLAVLWEQPDGTLNGLGVRESAELLMEELVALQVAIRTPGGAVALSRA